MSKVGAMAMQRRYTERARRVLRRVVPVIPQNLRTQPRPSRTPAYRAPLFLLVAAVLVLVLLLSLFLKLLLLLQQCPLLLNPQARFKEEGAEEEVM